MDDSVKQDRRKRRGWLRRGNQPGNRSKAPRCVARTRRGTPASALESVVGAVVASTET